MKKRFNTLRLNTKFVLIIITIVAIPIILFSFFLFHNMKETAVKNAQQEVQYSLEQDYIQIQKTVEMCTMTTQMFLNNNNLTDYLNRIFDREEMSSKERISFYREEVAALERMVTSNTYLYQVRVYVDCSDLVEMMPIIYRMDRMKRLSWADKEITESTWMIDFEDAIFSSYTTGRTKHIMSLVTPIEDYERGQTGIVEVAVKMDQILPEMFEKSDSQWFCLIDGEGNCHFEGSQDNSWSVKREEILQKVNLDAIEGESITTTLDGETVVIAYVPVKELSGGLVQIRSLKEEIQNINAIRNSFFFGLFIVLVLLIALIRIIVNLMFKQFYGIMRVVRQVQKGNLEVSVPAITHDEMGELGIQVNKMLERIRRLIDENINRERMMKNSEIRALQNQINAHFIYNVLESIKMMAEIREEYDISDAVTALGKLLRYSMKWDTDNVMVRQEMEYIKNYLLLINIRFDYTISLDVDMEPQVLKCNIPKLSLQPIIENAIYHGLEELADDAVIKVRGRIKENVCRIEIIDEGKGMNEEEVKRLNQKIQGAIPSDNTSSNGIGLKNVQQRIQLGFGAEYGITVEAEDGCYTRVTVAVPGNLAEEEET